MASAEQRQIKLSQRKQSPASEMGESAEAKTRTCSTCRGADDAPGVHENQDERGPGERCRAGRRGLPSVEGGACGEAQRPGVTGGDEAEPEDEPQKRGLNPGGHRREAMGNAEKPASRLTPEGRGAWPARIPALGTSVALSWASQAALVVKNPLGNAGDGRDLDLTPGSGRPPGGGHGNPLKSSCPENPTDRGAWRAAVHGVAESSLKRLGTHARVVPSVGALPGPVLPWGIHVSVEGGKKRQTNTRTTKQDDSREQSDEES